MHRAEAFMAIHDPVDRKNFDNALQTLRYEEALICQTALVKSRDASRKSKATACPETRLKDDFIASLPFALTNGQQQVIADISADMAHDYPMQRLLQGEVGSGKTVVAVAAMMQAVGSGGQAVLVAPTQVLAEQHYASISTMVSKLGKSDANSSDNQKNLDDANARRSNKRSAQSSKDGEFDAKTIHNNAVDKGVQLADLLDLAASDDMETGFSGKGNDIFGTKDGDSCISSHGKYATCRTSSRARSSRIGHALYRRGDARRIFQEFPGAEPHLGGDRRTAPLRCGTARIVEFQGFYGASSVGHDGHADSAHRSHDLVRRSRHFLADRTSRRPQADSHIRGAGRQCVVDGRNVCLIRKRIDAGERAYVVCPRIDADAEDADGALAASAASGSKTAGSSAAAFDDAYDLGEDDDRRAQRPPLHSVAEIVERLQSLPQFKGIRFATLTGRDDDTTKSQVMADFESGITPILVATTVIEVGVDVAKASCIVIFDADRYGLSQLHQLRGRVGRGGTDSGAFLISRAPADSDAARRLDVIQARWMVPK